MRSVSLNDIALIQAGNSAPALDEFSQSGIPFVRAGSLEFLTKGESIEKCEKVSPDLAKRNRLKLFKKGSILFAKSGMSAKMGRIYVLPQDCYVVSHLAIITVNDENTVPDYIKYFFLFRPPFHLIRDEAYPSITLKDIQLLKIDIPDLQIQRQIVAALDKAKAILDKGHESIELLSSLNKSLFLEMFESYLKNDIKNHKSLGDIASVVSGLTKGRKTKETEFQEVPYLRVANVQDNYFDLSEIKTIEATKNEIDRYHIEPGDIFLTEGGDPDKLGRGCVWKTEGTNFIYQNHLFRVRLLGDADFNPIFVNAVIGSNHGKRYFLKAAKQTTGIATINSRQLKAFPIPRVPLRLQQEFAERVLKIDQLKVKVEEKVLSNSQELFDSLLQQAFKGELQFNELAYNQLLIKESVNNFSRLSSNLSAAYAQPLASIQKALEAALVKPKGLEAVFKSTPFKGLQELESFNKIIESLPSTKLAKLAESLKPLDFQKNTFEQWGLSEILKKQESITKLSDVFQKSSDIKAAELTKLTELTKSKLPNVTLKFIEEPTLYDPEKDDLKLDKIQYDRLLPLNLNNAIEWMNNEFSFEVFTYEQFRISVLENFQVDNYRHLRGVFNQLLNVNFIQQVILSENDKKNLQQDERLTLEVEIGFIKQIR